MVSIPTLNQILERVALELEDILTQMNLNMEIQLPMIQ
jgi:hypothetical protein